MNELDLAYAAAIVDGEGSIHPADLSPAVEVGMCSEVITRWLCWTFGGVTRPSRTITGRPYWTWTLTGKASLPFLQNIRPYLKEKGSQADVAIALGQLLDLKPRHTLLTTAELLIKERLAQRLRGLNGGPKKTRARSTPALARHGSGPDGSKLSQDAAESGTHVPGAAIAKEE